MRGASFLADDAIQRLLSSEVKGRRPSPPPRDPVPPSFIPSPSAPASTTGSNSLSHHGRIEEDAAIDVAVDTAADVEPTTSAAAADDSQRRRGRDILLEAVATAVVITITDTGEAQLMLVLAVLMRLPSAVRVDDVDLHLHCRGDTQD